MKTFILTILAFGFICLMSCERTEILDNQYSKETLTNAELRSCRNDSLNSEGELHNAMVIEFINDFDTCYTNEEFTETFNIVVSNNLSTYSEILNISELQLNNLLNSIDFSEIDIISNSTFGTLKQCVSNNLYINENLFNAVILALNFVEQYDFINNSVIDFERDLCIFNLNRLGNLSYDDEYLYSLFLDVMIKSNKLWMDTNKGGMGYYSILKQSLTIHCGSVESRALNWGKIFCDDAVGAIAGAAKSLIMTGGASAAPTCGGIPCASLYGVASGAYASYRTARSQ